MVGYDVLVNGERRFTMVATDLGVLDAKVSGTRVEYEPGKILDTASVRGDFQQARGQDVEWSGIKLGVGDEVTIRLVHFDGVGNGDGTSGAKSAGSLKDNG